MGAGRFPTLPQHTSVCHHRGSNLQAQAGPHLTVFSVPTRCSTVSTLSVRSSRAARKKRAVRNRGQGTPTPPVSSSTLMHCEHPAPAHCPRVRAPTRAHPTNSTNKEGRGRGVTWVGSSVPSRQALCAAPSPISGRSRPGCKSHPNQAFPPGDRRAPMFSPLFR